MQPPRRLDKVESPATPRQDNPSNRPDSRTRGRVVKITRLLRLMSPYQRGSDVAALQAAIARRGNLYSARDGIYGPRTEYSVRQYQTAHRLAATGTVDAATARALGLRVGWAVRWNPVSLALYCHAHPGRIGYSEIMALRMWGVTHRVKAGRFPRFADCSAFCVWLRWACGMSDPTGLGFDGFGNSQSMWDNPLGKAVVGVLEAGDFCFYGRGGETEHVTIYVGNGMVVSHGMPGGPYLWRYRYRTDYMGARRYGR